MVFMSLTFGLLFGGRVSKLSEGSDTKMTEPIKGTEGTTEPTMPKLDVNE